MVHAPSGPEHPAAMRGRFAWLPQVRMRATFLKMVLGLCGLSNGWRAAARLGQAPAWAGEALSFCDTAVGAAAQAVISPVQSHLARSFPLIVQSSR